MQDVRIHKLLSSSAREANGSGTILVEDLAKRYADGTEAVRGISFEVRSGEVFGILGPNGAGKTTTMGMLGTLVRPTAGRATVAGYDVVEHPREVRRRIGFAMQEAGVDELATANELLVLHGRLHGLSRGEGEEDPADASGARPSRLTVPRPAARWAAVGRAVATSSGVRQRRRVHRCRSASRLSLSDVNAGHPRPGARC